MWKFRIACLTICPVLRGRFVVPFFFLLFFCIRPAFAQPGGEAGIVAGGAYYLGEYNPSRHFKNVGIYYGGFYRYNLNDRFAFRGTFGLSKLEYTNEYLLGIGATNYPKSFTATIKDITATVEFNFRSFMMPKTERSSLWSPYVFTGIGFLAAKDGGTLAIPFGGGVKFNLFRHIGLGVEWSARKTFSDKIDGLEDPWKTGEKNMVYSKDWVFVTGVTLSYRFPYDPECYGYK